MSNSTRWAVAQRILAGTATGALVLPLFEVTSCSGGSSTTWTGVGFYTQDAVHLAALAILLVAAGSLLAWPVTRLEEPARHLARAGTAAALSAGSLIVALGMPALTHLFDDTEPRIGWILQMTCWVVLTFGGIGTAIRAAARDQPWTVVHPFERVLAGLSVAGPLAITLLLGGWKVEALIAVLVMLALIGSPLSLGLLGIGMLNGTAAEGATRWRLVGLALAATWLGIWLYASFFS